jgi:hypothetical protein
MQILGIAANKLGTGILAGVLLLLASCADEASPEQQIRALIEQMELATEDRDVGDVVALLSPQYRDARGNGPEDVGRAIRGYFIANQSIHLLTRVQEISFPQNDEARATVLVGMVGREADAASAWNLAADLYEFELALIREDDEWRISWAEWRRR